MAEHIPAITLTDPHNHDKAPQSPVKGAEFIQGRIGGRETHHARDGSNRLESSSNNGTSWPSPGRLIRTLSSNTSSNNASSQSSIVPTAEGREEGLVNGNHGARQEIDPLSQHIMARSNQPLQQPPAIVTRAMSSENVRNPDERRQSEQVPAPAVREPQPVSRTDTHDRAVKDLRKGAKAVSFLSKLMGSSKKNDVAESEVGDDDEIANEGRPEGNDAEVFAAPTDRIGFNPRHPQPPSYIKVRSRHKKELDFDRLFLAQELESSRRPRLERQDTSNKLRRKTPATRETDTVWAMEFSRDGKHLAAAGAGTVVRVWAVISSPEDRQKHQSQESNANEANGVHAEHLSAPVFQRTPVKEFTGHTATVLDLSWSKNNFLLSSSMDKTVRLWHVSRSECLCTFKHTDFVPSISFHPKDDRFFLAGSLDSKLRLWSIPDKSVAYSAQVPDLITAVAFTPDGKFAMAGCLGGLCMFYETESLKYQTQIHVRSSRGQNAKGSKITGIQSHHAPGGDVKILITSNDSRVRLYNFRDKSLELKFKGNENNSSQIRATLSDDGRYVVCGSEDRKAYIWSLGPAEGEKRDKRPMEMFEAHNTIATAVCFAPMKTRHLLSKSEDPLYDLCNPPPVTLRSRAERAESQTSSTKAPTENGSVRHSSLEQPVDAKYDRPLESPAYLARSGHKEGNIIVTADYLGKIKVFRQDCAWAKRRLDDQWDRASLFTSKRSGGNSKLSRNGSTVTRASQRSLAEGGRSRTSTSTAPSSERILSWRSGIASTPSINTNTDKDSSGRSSSKHTNRSISPHKSMDGRSKATTSSAESSGGALEPTSKHPKEEEGGNSKVLQPSSPQRDKFNPNPLLVHPSTNQSSTFWNVDNWKAKAGQIKRAQLQNQHHHHLDEEEGEVGLERRTSLLPVNGYGGAMNRTPSYVSRLSDEFSAAGEGGGSSTGGEDTFEEAKEDLGEGGGRGL